MYKNKYLLLLIPMLNAAIACSCEGPPTEDSIKQEVHQKQISNKKIIVSQKLWQQQGVTTKQLQEVGKNYLGERVVTALLNDEPVMQLPEKVVHQIVKKVQFKEDSLRVATNFIRFVSAFSKQANYFNYYNRRGLTPLASLFLRPQFLNNYIGGTTGIPLLGMVQHIRGYAGIPCCHETASEDDKQKLKKILHTIATQLHAYRYRQCLGLYDQYIELITQGSKL